MEEELIIEEIPTEYSRIPGSYGSLSRHSCGSPRLRSSTSTSSKYASDDFFQNSRKFDEFSCRSDMFDRMTFPESVGSLKSQLSSAGKGSLLSNDRLHMKNSRNTAKEFRNFSSSMSHSSENRNFNRSTSLSNQSRLRSPTIIDADPNDMKIEHKTVSSSSTTKITTDKYSTEKHTSSDSKLNKVESGNVTFEEKSAASARKSKIEMGSLSSEEAVNQIREERSLHAGDSIIQDKKTSVTSASKYKTDSFSTQDISTEAQLERQHINQKTGIVDGENSQASIKQAIRSDLEKGISTKTTSVSGQNQTMLNDSLTSSNSHSESISSIIEGVYDDIDTLSDSQNPDKIFEGCSQKFADVIGLLNVGSKKNDNNYKILDQLSHVIEKARSVPNRGFELNNNFCDVLRDKGCLDILIDRCESEDKEAQYCSARLLENCLTTSNRHYIVEKGLNKLVHAACQFTHNGMNDVQQTRVGVGIIKNLFRDSENTCSDVIELGGLDAVLNECKANDVETLRNCAGALANLSLYGGDENQRKMISRHVPMWLFPLVFHQDDRIKYFACLAIVSLVANKEIEAEVIKSGTLDLVETFVTSHKPSEFGEIILTNLTEQNPNWLRKLIPVLLSHREEARNLAAFHFAMEASVKKKNGMTNIFKEIDVIEPLKIVASSPNAIASKFAAEALRSIGEEIPHKLSQQVTVWSIEDVKEWVKQIGFSDYCEEFEKSKVDGDILLQIDEAMLKEDIHMRNGILRKRFLRELNTLKKMADYSNCDSTNLNQFLQQLDPEFCVYTYQLLKAGIRRDLLPFLKEESLLSQCGINHSIHRAQLLDVIKNEVATRSLSQESLNKNLDAFISYRRSNGSQLASLLKVHMNLRGFSVFIDVERLEAGKFDNNLLNSIRQAKNFLLVLSPNALQRCIGDIECKDWVHKEIVCALETSCNIIPILDNFQWPDPEELPEDMKLICHFNAIRWIHDYQDACVDKLERFLAGDTNIRPDMRHTGNLSREDGSCSSPMSITNVSYSRTHSYESKD